MVLLVEFARAIAGLVLGGVAMAVTMAGGAVAAEPSGSAPTIPNLWDPRYHAERPAQGAVPAIRFVTTDDFPPFHFLDAAGRLTGFDVDLARAICDELAIPCTLQARPWEDLAPALAEGRADAAIAGIAISAESRRSLSFSDVYLRSPGRFAVRSEAAPQDISPSGLRGRSIAVAAGSAHEAFLAALFPDAARKPYPTAEAARAALKAGAVDAVFGDGVQLSFWLASETAAACCAFAGGPYLEGRFFGLGYAIAVGHDADTLRSAIDASLEAVYENGVYAELYLRYFPVGFY